MAKRKKEEGSQGEEEHEGKEGDVVKLFPL